MGDETASAQNASTGPKDRNYPKIFQKLIPWFSVLTLVTTTLGGYVEFGDKLLKFGRDITDNKSSVDQQSSVNKNPLDIGLSDKWCSANTKLKDLKTCRKHQ